MITRLLRLSALLLFLIAALFLLNEQTAAQPADNTGQPDSVVLTPPPGDPGPALSAIDVGYLSPATEAAQPFTHMLLRWEATVPVTDGLGFEARSSVDGLSWTAWGNVPQNPDLWVPQDGPEAYWSQTLYAGEGARFWQVRSRLTPAPNGALPTLHRVEVHTVDARFALDQRPTTNDQRDSSLVVGLSSLSKPPVLSRTAWGCPDGQGSRMRPVYYPVNHLVVHHTADANSLVGNEQNWGDRVRAEWSFHTFTRGWGDVGYNYLVAPDGTLYEGRAGGDDTVAFHDTANYGSMGVVWIGTYASVPPPAAAQQSLVNLLAWKADQKDIDPLGRSFYYGCSISNYCKPYAPGALVENIAGHRQVTPGHTSCPGDTALGLLPTIRNRVLERLQGGSGGGTPDNGDLLIDELESSFARSDATWYDGACGYGGHTFYTYTTDSAAESTNSATWRPTIATAGRYRVYAHIPQGCGLGTPPYASTRARYRISSAEGTFERTVDQNSAEEWIDLGAYSFAAGTAGAVELNDLTGEPYSQRRLLFFDSVKWVPETSATTSAELLHVAYERTTLSAGELLKVTFTVRNTGQTTLLGQAPQAGTRPDGSADSANGYVYDENECYLGDSAGTYAAFPKETGRFRVTLGAEGHTPPCLGATGGYPWRWGLDGDLQPGQQREIVGYVRFRTARTWTLQAGVVEEYVRYHTQGAAQTTITVTSERFAPGAAAYDAALQPLAYVYQLGSLPDNFLARTANPLSIPRGALVGSFAWDGSRLDWGDGGPLSQSDSFLVEQTRVFRVFSAGSYTFRTTSDDGSWLWVDGVPVVLNNGLHEERAVEGSIQLSAGSHVLAFKYFDRTGLAAAGYAMRAPGGSNFIQPVDDLGGGALRFGNTFTQAPALTLGADDGGGSGMHHLQLSWDGAQWFDMPGNLVQLGRLANGSYTLRYRAIDNVGNTGPTHELRFSVDTNLKIYYSLLPIAVQVRPEDACGAFILCL